MYIYIYIYLLLSQRYAKPCVSRRTARKAVRFTRNEIPAKGTITVKLLDEVLNFHLGEG